MAKNKNLKEFKESFKEEFAEKIDFYKNIALGKINPADLQDKTAVNMATNIAGKVVSSAASGFPFVGQVAATILVDIPKNLYLKSEETKAIKKAVANNNKISEFENEEIELIIEDAAYEIARIFEYQIAKLKTTTDVQILSLFAVEKIFQHARENKNTNFEQNDFIKALIQEVDSSFIKRIAKAANQVQTKFNFAYDRDNLKTKDEIEWKIDEIFTKPGIRQEAKNGGYVYKLKPTSKEEDLKYGYRAKIFNWNEEQKKYQPSDLDSGYTITAKSYAKYQTLSSNYAPLMRIVSQQEVDSFYTKLRTAEGNVNFANFLSLDAAKTIPVFRGISFDQGANLQGADFSGADMSKMMFVGINFQGSNLENARLTSSYIINTSFKSGKLTNVNMAGADLKNVDLSENTELTGVNYKKLAWDIHTNFSNNLSFNRHALKINSANPAPKMELNFLDNQRENEKQIREHSEFLKALASNAEQLGKQVENLQANNINNKVIKFSNVESRSPLSGFEGREGILKELGSFFLNKADESAIQVVSGLGGMGKTQTILKYIKDNKQIYDSNVRWISAENEVLLKQSFRSFAKDLGKDIEKANDDEILAFVRNKLADQKQKSLLVFDNVEDRDMIAKYLPDFAAGNKCHVIITTRLGHQWKQAKNTNLILLQPFSKEEAVSFVKSIVNDATKEDALKLAELFANIPLALSQGCSVIKTLKMTISDYLEDFNKIKESSNGEQLNKLMGENDLFNLNYKQNILVALNYNLEKISFNPKATEIIRIASYLAAEDIPKNIFDDMFNFKQDKLEAFSMLEILQLINSSQENGNASFSVHRLIQDVIKLNIQKENKAVEYLAKAMELGAAQLHQPGSYFDSKDVVEKNKPMLVHANSLLEHFAKISSSLQSKEDKIKLGIPAAKLFEGIGEFYSVMKQEKEALEKFNAALQIKIEIYGIEHEEYARTLNKLAWENHMLSNEEEALRLGEEALKVMIKLGKKEESLIAGTYNILAAVYRALGDQKNNDKSLELYEKSLKITINNVGEGHPSVAVTYNNMALVYKAQNEFAKALDLLEKSLDIGKKANGENHPDVARTYTNMANVYEEQGQREKSIEFHKKALAIKIDFYGNKHILVMDEYSEIAHLNSDLGLFSEAYKYFDLALQISQKINGENHKTTADLMIGVGNALFDLNRKTESLEQFEQAVEIYKIIFPNDNAEYQKYEAFIDTLKGILAAEESQIKFSDVPATPEKVVAKAPAKTSPNTPDQLEEGPMSAKGYISEGSYKILVKQALVIASSSELDSEQKKYNIKIVKDLIRELADYRFGEDNHKIARGERFITSLVPGKINLTKLLTPHKNKNDLVPGKAILEVIRKCGLDQNFNASNFKKAYNIEAEDRGFVQVMYVQVSGMGDSFGLIDSIQKIAGKEGMDKILAITRKDMDALELINNKNFIMEVIKKGPDAFSKLIDMISEEGVAHMLLDNLQDSDALQVADALFGADKPASKQASEIVFEVLEPYIGEEGLRQLSIFEKFYTSFSVDKTISKNEKSVVSYFGNLVAKLTNKLNLGDDSNHNYISALLYAIEDLMSALASDVKTFAALPSRHNPLDDYAPGGGGGNGGGDGANNASQTNFGYSLLPEPKLETTLLLGGFNFTQTEDSE